VLQAWPLIYANISGATLKVFYGFTQSTETSMKRMMGARQYSEWREWVMHSLTLPGVEYRGMVDHHTLAYELAQSG
jgi:hypothetical protein